MFRCSVLTDVRLAHCVQLFIINRFLKLVQPTNQSLFLSLSVPISVASWSGSRVTLDFNNDDKNTRDDSWVLDRLTVVG